MTTKKTYQGYHEAMKSRIESRRTEDQDWKTHNMKEVWALLELLEVDLSEALILREILRYMGPEACMRAVLAVHRDLHLTFVPDELN